MSPLIETRPESGQSHNAGNTANWRTLALFAGFVTLVGLIVWPSLAGRIQYAKTRAELAAIRDAAAGAELKSVGKLFTTLARVIGPAVVNVTAKSGYTRSPMRSRRCVGRRPPAPPTNR